MMYFSDRSRVMAWVLVLCACFGLSACGASSEGGDIGARCDTSDDCKEGLKCNSLGQCISVECMTAEQCAPGQICTVDNHCVDDNPDGDDGRCKSNYDCPFGFECMSDGSCVEQGLDRCYSSADCGFGEYCAANGECRPRQEADVDFPNPDGDEDDPIDPDGDEADGDQVPDGDDVIPDGDDEPAVDSDNDGIPDHIEDKNDNGIWDEGSETDLNNPDTDGDGIEDGVEDKNHDGIWQLNETDPLSPDTDFDKLGDGQEDANHNGEVDEGETDPRDEDSDDDGVIDGNELSGGYTDGASSDPLNKDSDGDTLPDGLEDANGNGDYEPEQGETDPTLADSDGDGTPDNEESVAMICQEEQVTDVTLYDSPDGDWTLALLPEFSYTLLEMNPGAGQRLVAATFEDTANKMAGFILARDPSSATAAEQVGVDNDLLIDLPTGGVLNHRGRVFISGDEFDGMLSHYTFETANRSVGELRNLLLSKLSGRGVGAIGNLPAGPAESAGEFEILFETLVRPDNVIVIFTVMTKARYDNAFEPLAHIRASDLTDGSSLRRSQKTTDDNCDPFRGTEPSVVDFVWVVDDSGSMDPDQAAVAAAADTFATVMTGAGIDFRVGVTSTACRDDGTLGDHKFTRDMDGFRDDVQDPPCGGSEYGLESGMGAINKAMNSTLPANERFRQDAAIIVIFLSDEEDQGYEDVQNVFGACWSFLQGVDPVCVQNWLDGFKDLYLGAKATAYAIVGDIPNGCGGGSPDSGAGAGEPGKAYIDVAYHTGGSFASICASDLTPTMDEILRSAAGSASVYELIYYPITSTIQVMIQGQEIPRNPTNGFEYDSLANTVVFYGDSRPSEGDDVVISYRYFLYDSKP